MSLRRFTWPLVAAVCLTCGSYLGTLSVPLFSPHTVHAADAKPTAPVQPEVAAPLAELSHAFRTVHNSIKDAVVNIDTKKAIPAQQNNGRRRFFFPVPVPPEMVPDDNGPQAPGVPGGPSAPGGQGGQGGQGGMQRYGTGSGVIISPDGYIVTNNHVVDGADSISVQLDDGRKMDGKVVGRDPKADLAVVKIDAQKLTYAKFGDSDDLDVGDWVLAFGSPFGFEQSMTQGIVSAKGRSIDIIAEHDTSLRGMTYENYIQTDAAINPGNSGGPLVNLKGEVIGINAAIASLSGAYNGIGFSIPSNDAKWIVDSIIKNGKVIRGYMGVGIVDINDTRDDTIKPRIKALHYSGATGILVDTLESNSPARKGGLQLDDIIIAFNGRKIETLTDLRSNVARTVPGTNITLGVFRGGKTVDVTFPVGTQPDTRVVAVPRSATRAPATVDLDNLGLTVSDSPKGVVITDVNPEGLAARTGLNKGDVIYSALGKEVRNVDELKSLLAKGSLDTGIPLFVHTPDGSDRSSYVMK